VLLGTPSGFPAGRTTKSEGRDMKTTKQLAGAVLCVASVIGMGSSAFAGEVTGSNKGGPNGDGVTGAVGNGNSPCLYSGLEDHEGEGADPGTGTQNWGHTKPFLLSIGQDVKGANGPIATPFGEDGCNARDFGLKGG
jgi:hypothetical protein